MAVISDDQVRSIEREMVPERAKASAAGMYLDLWSAAAVVLAVMAVLQAFSEYPEFFLLFASVSVGPFCVSVIKAQRLKKARARISAIWAKAMPMGDLHTPTGEAVRFVEVIDGHPIKIVVRHGDGRTATLELEDVQDGWGVQLVSTRHREGAFASHSVLRRLSNVDWRLDDGRVGQLRQVFPVCRTEFDHGYDLELKLDDGSCLRVPLEELTPIPSAHRA